jgi:DNA-binding transcriptional ArsR family regulator
MSEKYLLFGLDDDKAKNLGEVISNKTARAIVNLLAENEASETELASKLDMPLNTVEYNLKKLLNAGVIEKSRNYFWSKKGKKIHNYKVANKLIVIAPKKSSIYSKLKSVIPVVFIIGILTALVGWYTRLKNTVQSEGEYPKRMIAEETFLETSLADNISRTSETLGFWSAQSPVWAWFLIGALIGIVAFLLWNWRKL